MPAARSVLRSNAITSGRRYRSRQEEVNRDHARVRGKGERAVATLKTWKILTKLRCCPQRGTVMIQAILVSNSRDQPLPTMKRAP